MNLIIKIILSIFAFFSLSFLMFFTFISDDFTTNFVFQTEDSNLGIYKIDKNNNYKLSPLDKPEDYNDLKLYHVSMGNNVFYKEGNLRVENLDNQYNIILEEGIYFFDINDINTQYSIIFQGYKVKNLGPGAFVINTSDQKKKSVFSLSSKLNIEFLDINTSESLAQVDLFPNMYLLAFPRYNKASKNADLGKIITSHKLDMLSSPIYGISNIVSGNEDSSSTKSLNQDLKKYLFYNNVNYDNFISNVFDFRQQQINKKQMEYSQLSKDDFYLFPGEKYILKYYKYFLNDEKKKFYYKNIILKELVLLLGNKKSSEKEIQSIIDKMSELKNLDNKEYESMLAHILYYYDNIIYSQKKLPEIIINITIIKEKILTEDFKQNQPSLLQLRYIYDEYHQGNIQTFHKKMNSFVGNYEKEMNLSIYNEKHKIHNYFLYFLKNIFVGDFSKVKDHNQMVILFKKYIEINNVFIEQGDETIKKTALFDNAALIKVFINIMKISFFQAERQNKLLVLQKPAKITLNNYKILKTNLELLLKFQKDYKYLIENTGNRKDVILALSYLKYNKELNEFFEALSDYNLYELKHSEIKIIIEEEVDENQLTVEKAKEYLSKFTGANSPSTIIKVRNYGYCLSNDDSTISDGDEYCYEIDNYYVKGFKFDFFLIPHERNKIMFLNYYDNKNVYHNDNIEHFMDDIEDGWYKLFQNAKVEDRDKYDFKRFFINKYVNAGIEIKKDPKNEENKIDPFPIPEIGEESIAEENLKLKLLTKNSPLQKIKSILPITYKYIKIIEEKGEFIGKIFPTSFKLKITSKSGMQNYTGKFEGKYIFKGNNHSFTESKIYIKNTTSRKKYIYFLDTKPINIKGTFKLSDTLDIFNKTLANFTQINSIYLDLQKKFNSKTESIIITYNIDKDIVQFNILNTYTFNLKNNGSVDIYKGSSNIFTGHFNQITKFLNTLQ